jgi:hypothetical protein
MARRPASVCELGHFQTRTSALNDSSTAPPSDTSVPMMTLPPNTSCLQHRSGQHAAPKKNP